MAQKKVTGVKSVTLGDVKAVEGRTGIKSVGSASTHEEDDEAAKDVAQDAKDHDDRQKEEAKQAKDVDRDAKKVDRKVKSGG